MKKELTPMRKGVIDQIEGNQAVIEWLDNGERMDLPCRELPEKAQVGDVLFWDGTTWKVDQEETAQRKREIGRLMEELWED